MHPINAVGVSSLINAKEHVRFIGRRVVKRRFVKERKTYLVLDKINPRLRAVVSALLIATGFLLQLSTKNILIGIPFIILCLVLNLIKSVTVKRVTPSQLKWQEVTPEKVEQVLAHCRRVKKFRSQNIGCYIGLIIGIFIFGIFLLPVFNELSVPFSLIVTIVNAVILFSGLMLSGRKSAWMPYALDIKAEIVKRIIELPGVNNDPSLQVIPYLEIGEAKNGSFPNDARVLIRFREAPDAFIGLQGQISINTVKSKQYPYFYVVLLARPAFGLFKKFKRLKLSLDNVTMEQKRAGEVDVIVMRQPTTKTSGYHTNQKTQDYILQNGIRVVKELI
jgi:hypothetical protein